MAEIFINILGTKSLAVNNCNEMLRVVLLQYFHKLYARACSINVAFMCCDAVVDDVVPADKIFSVFEITLSQSVTKVFEFFLDLGLKDSPDTAKDFLDRRFQRVRGVFKGSIEGTCTYQVNHEQVGKDGKRNKLTILQGLAAGAHKKN